MLESHVQCAAIQFAPEAAAVHHVSGNGVGAAEQMAGGFHVPAGQGGADFGTGHTQTIELIAVHARHVKALLASGLHQHVVVAGSASAKAEVVAHQEITHAQALEQHLVDKGLGLLIGKGLIEGQHHALVDAAST